MAKDIVGEEIFDYAPGWKPNPGDWFVGEVIGLDKGSSEWGAYPIVTYKLDTGEKLALHAFHKVAKNALRSIRPTIGTRMGVKYLGEIERKESKGDLFHGYQFRVLDQVSAEDFWGAVPEEGDMFSEPPPF